MGDINSNIRDIIASIPDEYFVCRSPYDIYFMLINLKDIGYFPYWFEQFDHANRMYKLMCIQDKVHIIMGQIIDDEYYMLSELNKNITFDQLEGSL
jgi:hypothetical protein